MSDRMPRHLISIDDLDRTGIERILDRAESFAEVSGREIKKVPALRGRTVVNLFYEARTRTSSSFELAAKRLSADVSIRSAGSSVDKGESLKDTVHTLSAYDPAAIVIRSPHAGAAQLVAGWTPAAVINAGDGKHEHPTQALLDVFTLRRELGALDGARIWIVGDVLHSRVARSNILAFTRMGAQVTVCGPPTLIPGRSRRSGARRRRRSSGCTRPKVVYVLRMQNERMKESFVPSLREYAERYQVNAGRLRPGQLLMHPGRSTAASSCPPTRSIPPGADRRAGEGRGGGADGRPLRAAGRLADAGGGGLMGASPLFSQDLPPAELLIRGAHVLDPRSDIDEPQDVLIRNGRIAELGLAGSLTEPDAGETIDAGGKHLFPGFVDPHVHLRTPGGRSTRRTSRPAPPPRPPAGSAP